MNRIPDDPMIRAAQRKGYVRDPEWPVCPICGQCCDTVFRSARTQEIIGCQNCVAEKDAWETDECFPEKE